MNTALIEKQSLTILRSTKKDLTQMLKPLLKAVAPRTKIEPLTHIAFTDEGYLIATNMETYVTTADTDEVGSVIATCSASMLNKSISKLKQADTVTIDVIDGKVSVLHKYGTVRLESCDPIDYPALPVVDYNRQFSDPLALQNACNWVSKCASKDESRPVLTGIGISVSTGGMVHAACTDSYRLYVENTRITGDESLSTGVILPASIVSLPVGEWHSIRFNHKYAAILTDGFTVYTRLIEGQFPQWEQLIPKSGGGSLRVETGAVESLRYADSMQGSRNNPVAINSDGYTSTVQDSHDITSPLIAVSESGSDRYGFNAGFLADLIESIGIDAQYELSTPLRPLTARNGDHTAVLMPVRLTN